MADPVRYSDTLTLRCSPSLNAAIDQAAKARGTRPSEWCRQALQTGLALDGVTMAPRDTAVT
jgi:predicted HicB family RNase H-like nuclease